jgi:hypothetical protein
MPRYTVRVELHEVNFVDPSGDDYESLHTAMQRNRFFRVIKNSKGNWYHMPSAEYTKETSEESVANIASSAHKIAKAIWEKASVLATKSNGRQWIDLKPASAAEVRQLTSTNV